MTIADLPLLSITSVLEVIDFDLTPYIRVKAWYDGFKFNHTDLWALAEKGLEELKVFEKNRPDLSHIQHPLHPTNRLNQNQNIDTKVEDPVVLVSSEEPIIMSVLQE